MTRTKGEPKERLWMRVSQELSEKLEKRAVREHRNRGNMDQAILEEFFENETITEEFRYRAKLEG